MLSRPRRETPIERIFREVNGRKMSAAIKRILLSKPKAERKAGEMLFSFQPMTLSRRTEPFNHSPMALAERNSSLESPEGISALGYKKVAGE